MGAIAGSIWTPRFVTEACCTSGRAGSTRQRPGIKAVARVRIAGAGLAGSAAALAALDHGAAVRLWDPAKLPRHKVCGEVLTAEIEPVLRSIGLWDAFLALQPAPVERVRLGFAGGGGHERVPST